MVDFSILWESNDPEVGTGYGVVTKNVTKILKALGYKVVILANWGRKGFVGNYEGIPVFPGGNSPFAEDKAALLIQRLKIPMMIGLLDIWAAPILPDLVSKIGSRYVSYSPVDCLPIPESIEIPSKKSWRVLSMTKITQEEFEKVGVKSTLVEHGVNTELFRPLEDEERKKILIAGGFKGEEFIFGSVGANKGLRKNFPDLFEAFRLFLDNNPDAKNALLYIHSPPDVQGGVSLTHLKKIWNLEDKVVFTDEFSQYRGLTEQEMAVLFNIFDVFVLPTMGEGFGLPIIEAQACGTPVIATKCTSIPELVLDHGWQVPWIRHFYNPIGAYHFLIDVNKLAEAMGEAYNDDNKRKKYGTVSRAFSLQYDWKKIVTNKWVPFLETCKEEIER